LSAICNAKSLPESKSFPSGIFSLTELFPLIKGSTEKALCCLTKDEKERRMSEKETEKWKCLSNFHFFFGKFLMFPFYTACFCQEETK